jgi:hypothetical protein
MKQEVAATRRRVREGAGAGHQATRKRGSRSRAPGNTQGREQGTSSTQRREQGTSSAQGRGQEVAPWRPGVRDVSRRCWLVLL